jgi:hypothetical protein
VLGYTPHLGEAFCTDLLKKGHEGVLPEPICGFGKFRHREQVLWNAGWKKIAQDSWLSEARLAMGSDFDGEEPLMRDLTQAIHDTSAVEVEPCWSLVFQRIEARPFGEDLACLRQRMTPHGFKERVSRSDPLQVMLLGCVTISGTARISGCQRR